jgi:hypothetical protein
MDGLMAKVRERGVPLAEFVGAKPCRGVLTELNEAFLIDDATRAALIREDPGCGATLKPYLRGQDIGHWVPDWQGLWIIFARRGKVILLPTADRYLLAALNAPLLWWHNYRFGRWQFSG